MSAALLGLLISLAIGAVIAAIGALALLIARAIEDYYDRRYTPSPEEAAWNLHCATTPGVGEVGDSPIFDALCVDFWERSYQWPEVYDFDEWPGHAS